MNDSAASTIFWRDAKIHSACDSDSALRYSLTVEHASVVHSLLQWIVGLNEWGNFGHSPCVFKPFISSVHGSVSFQFAWLLIYFLCLLRFVNKDCCFGYPYLTRFIRFLMRFIMYPAHRCVGRTFTNRKFCQKLDLSEWNID